MTAFLWHLTALLAVLLAMRALGLTQPEVGTAGWWWSRPVWFLVLSVPTAASCGDLRPIRPRAAHVPGTRRGVAQRGWTRCLRLPRSGFIVFSILVSVTGVDVLGNRPQFFLFGEVTPAAAFAVLLAGLALLKFADPRREVAQARLANHLPRANQDCGSPSTSLTSSDFRNQRPAHLTPLS